MRNKRKHVLTLILFCSLVFSIRAQQQHPYLFFTPDRIATLKEQLKSDKEVKANYTQVEQVAREALKENNPYRKLEYLALTYQVTGEKRYADKIKESIRQTGGKETLEAKDMLNREPAWTSLLSTAHANHQMAIGFDAIYNELSDEERKELAQAIYKIGIRPTLHDWLSPATRFHAINSMGHNYWASCIAMTGIAAMAVSNEIPEAAEWIDMVSRATTDWANFQGDILQNKPANFDNGAYYESVSYANYGLTQYLTFRLAMQNFNPRAEWPERKLFERAADYFMYTCYPADSDYLPSLYFGDSNIAANGEGVLKLLWTLGFQKTDMLWYLTQVRKNQAKESMPTDTPMGLLYTPDLSDAPLQPSLSLSTVYERMGWSVMRTSWEKNTTLLGVKCGHTWNHSHADAGSFILFHNGQQVIKDGGNCWYPNPWYREYFFHSQAHNVLLFNGQAQPQEQQYKGSMLDGSLHHLTDEGNIKYILANVTGPTSRYFSKNHRSFLWIDDVILVIDDVCSHEDGTFSLLFHPDGVSRKNGIDLSVVNQQAAVDIRPLWPDYLTESDFEHDFPYNLKLKAHQGPKAKKTDEMETYYSVTYPIKAQSVKFITAIILKDSPASKNIPQVTRLKGDDLQGVRIAKGDKITDVYLNTRADGHIMHRNSCTNVNGWDTDAYLLAFSYKKGTDPAVSKNISEWFIGYGSYVRNANESIFDSYTKKYKVIR